MLPPEPPTRNCSPWTLLTLRSLCSLRLFSLRFSLLLSLPAICSMAELQRKQTQTPGGPALSSLPSSAPLFFVRGRTKADRRAGGTLFCGKALEGERSLEVDRALGVERSDGSGWLQTFEVPGMVSNECSDHTKALSLRGEPVCPEPEPSVTTGSALVIPSDPRGSRAS